MFSDNEQAIIFYLRVEEQADTDNASYQPVTHPALAVLVIWVISQPAGSGSPCYCLWQTRLCFMELLT